MLVPIIGIPTPRTVALVNAAAQALTDAGHPTEVLVCDSVKDATVGLMTSAARALLVLVTLPDAQWQRVLGGVSQRYLYLHTDPLTLVDRISPSAEPYSNPERSVESLRYWTKTLSSMATVQGPNCLTTDVEADDTPAILVRHLWTRLGIQAGMPDLKLDPMAVEETEPGPEPWREASRQMLSAFRSLQDGTAPEQVVASAALFFRKGNLFIVEPLRVPSEPGNLFFGPYVYLPPGIWSVEVKITLPPELAGRSFKMDVVTGFGADVATASIYSLLTSGQRSVSLEFRHANALSPVEARFYCEGRGAEGDLLLNVVTFQKLADVS
jgi:hypothetical protein